MDGDLTSQASVCVEQVPKVPPINIKQIQDKLKRAGEANRKKGKNMREEGKRDEGGAGNRRIKIRRA